MLVLIDEIVGWRAGLDDLLARFAHRFGRAEPRRQALTYMVGLLSPLASKNGWTLAEAAGDATPDRMQRLLNRSAWDPDAVRDDLFAYVSEHLGHDDGVLSIAVVRRGAASEFGQDFPAFEGGDGAFAEGPDLGVVAVDGLLPAG